MPFRSQHSNLLSDHKQTFKLSPAISAAFALHVAIFFILSLTPVKHLALKDKTVAVVELSLAAPQPQSASQQERTTSQKASKKVVQSKSASQFASPERPANSKSAKPKTLKAPDLPSIEPVTRKQNNTPLRSNRSNHLSPSSASQKKLRQDSTRTGPLLNEYELALLKRLTQKNLYDKYHAVAEQAGIAELTFELSLTLFSNGAIKSASVDRSSGLGQIDSLAIQTAYNASPYPRPPKEDASKGFTYTVPIKWVREES